MEIAISMEAKRQEEIDFRSIKQSQYKNLSISNIFLLSDIEETIKASDADIVFIDFVQNIVSNG